MKDLIISLLVCLGIPLLIMIPTVYIYEQYVTRNIIWVTVSFRKDSKKLERLKRNYLKRYNMITVNTVKKGFCYITTYKGYEHKTQDKR